jgi:hypothetical protein
MEQTLKTILRSSETGAVVRKVSPNKYIVSNMPSWTAEIEYAITQKYPDMSFYARHSSESLSGFVMVLQRPQDHYIMISFLYLTFLLAYCFFLYKRAWVMFPITSPLFKI